MNTQSLDSTLLCEAAAPATSPERLWELCQHKNLWQTIASNPNINSKTIDKLALQRPLEILCNCSIVSLEQSGQLLPTLSLASRLSLLLASPQQPDLFPRYDIRKAIIQALGSVSRLTIQRTECWSRSLYFCIKPGSIDDWPDNEVSGRIDTRSEEYGESVVDMNGTNEEANKLRNLKESIREICEYDEDSSSEDVVDALEMRLARPLSALSSGQVDRLESEGFISGEYESVLDEICMEHTARQESKCELASHSSGSLVDNMTIDIHGIEVELRCVNANLIATWQTADGAREVEIESSWDPSDCQSDQAGVTVSGLGDLSPLWGWTPFVRNDAVPDDWSQYIVDGLINEARASHVF